MEQETIGQEELTSEQIDALTLKEESPETPAVVPAQEQIPDDIPATPETPKPAATELTLAEQALADTAEPAEVDPKDAVIGDFRRQVRDLKDQVQQLQPTIAPPAVLESPLEKAAIEQGVTVDEVLVTGKIHNEQAAFEAEQREANTQNTRMAIADQAYGQAVQQYSDEALGAGLGLGSLETLGKHLLTPGDKTNIVDAGQNAGAEALTALRLRIIQAGGEVTAIYNARVKARPPLVPASPTTPTVPAPAAVPVVDEGGPELRASTQKLSNFMQS